MVTEEISNAEQPEGHFYHSQCFSQFCAVKRPSSPNREQCETSSKTTLLSSSLPGTNDKGVLKHSCVFCGKTRKRKRDRTTESLHQCITSNGSKAIICAARNKGDTRILAIGEDLIAKEVKYHHSCRRDYLREESMERKPAEANTNRKIHNEAFEKISVFLQNEVINKQTPMMASAVLRMYKEEYTACGGAEEDIKGYSVQSLMLKIGNKFRNIIVDKQSNKSGSFVFPSSMSPSDALAIVNRSNPRIEEIRSAAMALRTEILAMPKYFTPTPTSVHILKENAPDIPPLVLLFFRTLFDGLLTGTESNESSEVTERKALAIASDAVFNCTRGRIRPWKQISLGLGLGTLRLDQNPC